MPCERGPLGHGRVEHAFSLKLEPWDAPDCRSLNWSCPSVQTATRNSKEVSIHVDTYIEQNHGTEGYLGGGCYQEDRRSGLESFLCAGSDDLSVRLQDHQGSARPDEASAAVLFLDAGGKGQPRLWRAGCSAARRHVPQRRTALGRMDEAVSGDHPVSGKTFIEYGTTDRDKSKESYAEMWHRWVYDDYYRTYMLPMENTASRSTMTT